MNFPIQVPIEYSNPAGNLLASGLYRSYLTQDIANDFPQWMKIRHSEDSVGQQLIAAEAVLLEKIQNDMEYNIRSKFLLTSPLEDIDLLYKANVPGNVNLLSLDSNPLSVIAAPYGYQITGNNQIDVQEVSLLEDFYYNVLPTRIEITSSGNYSPTINGTSWNMLPSGVPDRQAKKIDRWKNKHNITWCASASGLVQKQDAITMESYETYAWNDTGIVNDLWFNDGYLWAMAADSNGSYLALISSKTQQPPAPTLDYLCRFNLSGLLPPTTQLTGVMIDASGFMWASDSTNSSVFGISPRYDYFIYDQKTRAVYMREDYRYSGVLISNT